MDLKARRKTKKQNPVPEQTTDAPLVQVMKMESQDNPPTYAKAITIQFNAMLYITLQNMISSAHTANDFTYTSVSDVIRAALQAYQEGMNLTELDEPGERRSISIRFTQSQHKFYKSLPNRMHRKILERAVRTFLKSQ